VKLKKKNKSRAKGDPQSLIDINSRAQADIREGARRSPKKGEGRRRDGKMQGFCQGA